MNTDTIKPPTPAKQPPTAQTVLKCLNFATYSAYWLHRQQTRNAPPVERLNDNNTNTTTDNNTNTTTDNNTPR
jgi:hypothetical protein